MKIIQAPSSTTELTGWIGDNMDAVKQDISETGLVLFRGFDTFCRR